MAPPVARGLAPGQLVAITGLAEKARFPKQCSKLSLGNCMKINVHNYAGPGRYKAITFQGVRILFI